jgi:hypothetical protein
MKYSNFLNNSYNFDIENTYIIYFPNNYISVDLANRCLDSCKKINQKAELYEGFDGTENELKIPEHLKNQNWYKWLKVTDYQQSLSEVACSLSHISLWVKCMELDRPIVILEHDVIMIKSYKKHQIYNGIGYLGSIEYLRSPELINNRVPMYSSINKNWNFINRAHAYSIDPAVARKLFTCVLSRGIYESLDIMIRADDVAIVQNELYAYDLPGQTVINSRKK